MNVYTNYFDKKFIKNEIKNLIELLKSLKAHKNCYDLFGILFLVQNPDVSHEKLKSINVNDLDLRVIN